MRILTVLAGSAIFLLGLLIVWLGCFVLPATLMFGSIIVMAGVVLMASGALIVVKITNAIARDDVSDAPR